MSLIIRIPKSESWDAIRERFIYSEETTLELEHSLVSLSKWESKLEKPFLSPDKKTMDETYAYVQIMSKNYVELSTLHALTSTNITDINTYIEAKHSATWFSDLKRGPQSREIITAEIIYYYMFSLQIPLEAEHWHLNRLFTLIKVMNEKNQPKKKMGRAEQIAQQRALNSKRLEQLKTTG